MNTPLISTAALLLLAAAMAPLQVAAQAQSVSDESGDMAEEDQLTCKREDVTGSRVKKRTVCSSEKQRREEREKTGEALDELRMQGTVQRANGG